MRRAICAYCGHDVAVRKDGVLRVHGYQVDPVTNIPGGDPCPGSGKPPKDREDP